MMRIQFSAVAAGVLAALTLTACGGGETDAPTVGPSTTPSAFPYPPVQYYTDVAVRLEEPLRSAAEFALEMTVGGYRMVDPRESEQFRREYRTRVDLDADRFIEPFETPDFVDDTGGYTVRAVSAEELADGVIEVSVCSFNIPGVYWLRTDGQVVDPEGPKVALTRPRVQWTDRSAAIGPKPSGPRWLLLDNGVDLKMTEESAERECDPFKPEPFVQKMPDPTTPVVTPTR
ncbi:hypothetical protein [Nocardia sp. NPDC050406]|uniref:hypothetical protein n=1 Tax=Nocardia sp. NPDC050406 TaxID=3364318 RepID=UPI0037B7FA8A